MSEASRDAGGTFHCDYSSALRQVIIANGDPFRQASPPPHAVVHHDLRDNYFAVSVRSFCEVMACEIIDFKCFSYYFRRLHVAFANKSSSHERTRHPGDV